LFDFSKEIICKVYIHIAIITFRSILELRELMLSGHIEDKGEDDD